MSDSLLMGFDLGGSGVRCVLVEPGGALRGAAAAAWRPSADTEIPLAFTYAPEATWDALARVARRALETAGSGAAARVSAVAATSVRHASALLDAQGHTLLLSANKDARGTGSAFTMAAERGAEVHARTGHWPHPIQPAHRLRAIAERQPELLAKAASHVALSDWLAHRLCGEVASEATQACETALLDLERGTWSEAEIEACGLPRALFPALRAPGDTLGNLTAEAASTLGLEPGLPVAVGAGDTQTALVGAGVVAPGELAVVAGTTAPVVQLVDAPLRDDEARVWSGRFAIDGVFGLESNAGAAGDALEFAASLVFPGRAHPLLHLFEAAGRAPAGNAGFLSTLGAEIMDARALSLPTGTLAMGSMADVGEAGGNAQLSRALLEGIAFGLRANAEQLRDAGAGEPTRVTLTGGLSRSAVFAQIVAEVLGCELRVAGGEYASAIGAAACAGVACGAFASLGDAAAALGAEARHHTPAPDARTHYVDLYPHWRAQRGVDAAPAIGAAALATAAASSRVPTARGAASFRPRILVTADMDDASLDALREIGEVDYKSFRTAMRMLTGPSLAEALEGVHVLITEIDVIDAAGLLESPDLRVVGVCRGDAVNVDLAACEALGIAVFHTPARNADAVADLTLAYLLGLARKLTEANAFLREPGGRAGDMGRMGHAYSTLQGRELWRKTVGLVGFGGVARKVATRLAGFGARCIAYDPFLADDTLRLHGAEPADLDTLLATSDFVSLHAAVTEETRGLIGSEEIARMREGACLINTARAALIDEEALTEALRSGHLAGAALDVFSVEPPASDAPLLQLPNVIATPHLGGNTVDVAAHQGATVAAELSRLARGEALAHPLCATAEDFDWSTPRPALDPALRDTLGQSRAPAVSDLQRDVGASDAEAAEAPRVDAAGASGAGPIHDAMRAVLARFLEIVRDDAPLARFAASAGDVTLHFLLTDLDAPFHLGFHGGQVIAGHGAPASDESVVELRLPADLFDGMLTGRRNAMQAAMNGELSFSGDTAKAMTLQQITDDLGRVYLRARDEAGDPGDLTQLAAPDAPSAQAAASDDDIRLELCRIVDELYANQLITATGGNVSVRVEGEPHEAWITPSQLFKGDLAPEILVRIGLDGKAVQPGGRSPSSEALMHTAVLAAKPEATAVIHCHAPNATILVNADLPFLPVSTEAAFFQNLGRIPFIMPGTGALAEAIVEAMGDGWAVLMKNHGLLVAGRTLRRAADMAEIIERSAEIILGCRAVGVDPPVLPEDVVETLAQYGDLMA